MTTTAFDVGLLPRVAFDADHRDPILRGDKTATVRYGDAGASLSAGDSFVATDPDGEPWGVLTATAVVESQVAQVPDVIEAFRARYPHDHPAAVAVGLERYYDRTISLDTEVRTIVWGGPRA